MGNFRVMIKNFPQSRVIWSELKSQNTSYITCSLFPLLYNYLQKLSENETQILFHWISDFYTHIKANKKEKTKKNQLQKLSNIGIKLDFCYPHHPGVIWSSKGFKAVFLSRVWYSSESHRYQPLIAQYLGASNIWRNDLRFFPIGITHYILSLWTHGYETEGNFHVFSHLG